MRLQLQQKEQFFHEIEAGVRSGAPFQEVVRRMAAGRQGPLRNVAAAMASTPLDATAEDWFAAATATFSQLDREIIRSGEISGRLDRALTYLRDYYGALARARRRFLAKLAYPVVIFHLGAILLALPAAVQGGLAAFVRGAGVLLGVFYLAAIALWAVWTAAARTARVQPAFDRFLQSLPVIGGARVALVGSRFCTLLGLLVRAGASILTSLERTAAASGSASFQRAARQAAETVRQGSGLADAIIQTGAFPEEIDRAFQTGEESGRLDDELARQGDRFTERLYARLDTLSSWLPFLVYLAILATLAWKIVQFWSGYFQSVQGILGETF